MRVTWEDNVDFPKDIIEADYLELILQAIGCETDSQRYANLLHHADRLEMSMFIQQLRKSIIEIKPLLRYHLKNVMETTFKCNK